MVKALAAYCQNPNATFKDQEEGEVVLLLLRRHPVTNGTWVTLTVLLVFLPIVFFLFPHERILPAIDFLPLRYVVFIFVAWYLSLFGFVLISLAGWLFNLDLVTDRRIMDIDYWGFLFFNVAEAPLTNIQDITYRIHGLGPTFFNFGSVYIQTAGTAVNFEFDDVPNPAAVHDLITDVMGRKNVKSL